MALDLAASVRARLLNIAKTEQTDYNSVLVRYALRTYPVYTVVAEKLHAMVLLGMANSRLKDYLDLSVLLEREVLDPATLAAAIAATFTRRGTTLPTALPIGLSDEFANDQSRQALWAAFLKKNALPAVPLISVVTTLHATLQPALRQAASTNFPL